MQVLASPITADQVIAVQMLKQNVYFCKSETPEDKTPNNPLCIGQKHPLVLSKESIKDVKCAFCDYNELDRYWICLEKCDKMYCCVCCYSNYYMQVRVSCKNYQHNYCQPYKLK